MAVAPELASHEFLENRAKTRFWGLAGGVTCQNQPKIENASWRGGDWGWCPTALAWLGASPGLPPRRLWGPWHGLLGRGGRRNKSAPRNRVVFARNGDPENRPQSGRFGPWEGVAAGNRSISYFSWSLWIRGFHLAPVSYPWHCWIGRSNSPKIARGCGGSAICLFWWVGRFRQKIENASWRNPWVFLG